MYVGGGFYYYCYFYDGKWESVSTKAEHACNIQFLEHGVIHVPRGNCPLVKWSGIHSVDSQNIPSFGESLGEIS